ncbi:hypothetical protein [Rhizobium terrae]|uniref:hypothetical protein n=1 Tax=Rhizobium terrae TaxID=2171756 RepID=UPI000E3DAB88|nr:hypothetical protein [Rhizobium terrae]
MTANAEEHKYTATFIQQSIDNLLHCSRVYGLDVHDGLMKALNVLEETPCESLDDALAFINIGRSIREQSFHTLGDPAHLHDVHNVCEWYVGIGVKFIEGMRERKHRPIHAANDTMQ